MDTTIRIDKCGAVQIIPIAKMNKFKVEDRMPQYKLNCMEGDSHPLEIEKYHYTLCHIFRASIDSEVMTRDITAANYARNDSFNPVEQSFIRGVLADNPAVDWAINNSFDGLYISRYAELATLTTIFIFRAYLLEKHITFWKLKFAGTQ